MIMLDARTLDDRFRITSFCVSLEQVLAEFFTWVKDNGIAYEDIWYADVFALDPNGVEGPKRVCCIEGTEENKADIIPKADGASPWAFRARPIKGFIKKITKT